MTNNNVTNKKELTCFGHFDGCIKCIQCFDAECRKVTDQREKDEDEADDE